MGYKKNDTCLKKAADDEPIFVLRGQDKSSAKVVMHWIAKNFDTCPDEKLREAFEHALKMKNYSVKKNAD